MPPAGLARGCYGDRSSWQDWCNQKARKQRLLCRRLSPWVREAERRVRGSSYVPSDKPRPTALNGCRHAQGACRCREGPDTV
jgi:hypothetical protein